LVRFRAHALLVCAPLYLLWPKVEAFARAGKGLSSRLRLLNYSEMQELFPDCTIRRERSGMTKAYIASN
jgi:hypothetical protein